MSLRRVVFLAGPASVSVYAASLAIIICVADPAAAVPTLAPSAVLDTIAERTGQNPVTLPIAVASAGIALAITASILGATFSLTTKTVGVMQLAILAGGAPAYFVASFPLGLDVADTFGVSGGVHTPWAGMLYLVSLATFVAAMVVAYRPASHWQHTGNGSREVHP